MNPESFYGRSAANFEESSDEEFSSDEELSDVSEYEPSDSSSTGVEEDEEEDTATADVVTTTGTVDGTSGLATLQNSWTATSVGQRNFGFTGQETLCIQAVPSHEGKIWPIDVFSLFISDDIISLMVRETNRYACQVIAEQSVTRHSRLNSWKPTSSSEIKTFIGILFYMGIHKLPQIALYWSKSKLYDGRLIPSVMQKDRFLLLLRMFHFADNTVFDSPVHRLHKIQPLCDALIENFQKIYAPGSTLVIDETVLPFRGRLSFRQYIPSKRHKYGCKLFKLCTSEAYTWNFEIYCGQIERHDTLMFSEAVVTRLMSPLLQKGHSLYTDNYYTSVKLAQYLLSRKTYLCGTVRSNRKGLPREVTQAKLKRGEIKGMENNDGIKVFNWKDKRNVMTLSSLPEHDDVMITTGKRSRNGEEIVKPKSVVEYNAAKKGVDVSDQMSSYYSSLRKTKKWYKKVAIELITGTSAINAWLIFNKYYVNKPWSLLKFKESLVLSLLTGEPAEEVRSGRRSASINKGPTTEHYLVEAPGPKRSSRKRCLGCYELISLNEGSREASKKAKKVSTYCASCESKPYLCLSCFKMKHSD